MGEVIDISGEPRGECYANLLTLCIAHCSEFLLIVRDQLPLAPEGRAVLEDLKEYLMTESRRAEWPGTALCLPDDESKATVRQYRFNERSKAYLESAVSGLYEWRQPDRPEDLCLLRRDGSPFLVSTAHERDAYVEPPDGLEEQVRSDLVTIGVKIRNR